MGNNKQHPVFSLSGPPCNVYNLANDNESTARIYIAIRCHDDLRWLL